MAKQLDLFGKEVDLASSTSTRTTRPSKRNEAKYIYKSLNGIDDEHFCKDCIHCIKKNNALKCERIDVSSNSETDLYSNEKACKAFEGK